MTKNQKTILLAVLGVLVVIVIAVVGAGVWIFTSLVNNESMTEADALKTIDDVRARFGAVQPVVDLRPDGPVLLRRPPETKPPGELKTLHVLRWSGQDEEMARLELPFSLLRMRDSVFRVKVPPDSTGVSTSTSIGVADVERYGPTLLVDGMMPDGGRVLIWSD